MASKKKTQDSETQTNEALVYVGPTLAGSIRIQRFGLFKTLTPAIQEAVDADQELKRLFVPVSDLAKAREELTRPTRLARAYQAMTKKYGKVVK